MFSPYLFVNSVELIVSPSMDATACIKKVFLVSLVSITG